MTTASKRDRRREDSVQISLGHLREIEAQRIEDEQAEIAKDSVANPERLYRDDQSRITPPKNPSADKHSIYNSKRYGNLPMTPCQATRINAMGSSAEKYLSPSQLIFLKKMEELMAHGAEVGDFPKPDWTSLGSFGSDARNLQTKLGLTPRRIW